MLSVHMIEHLRAVSEQLAVSATRNMDAPVQHCPGWTVRDLVVHIGEVQRFWVRIVGERLTARPTDLVRGVPGDAEPIEWFRSQTTELVSTLTTCADDVALWTWWDPEQNAAWVKRRQMNEVVVHAWDAGNAVGMATSIPTDVAVVGLQEFVDVFSRDLRDGAEPPPVALVATDCDWRAVLFAAELVDPDGPNMAGSSTAGSSPVGSSTMAPTLELRGSASEILLSLWGRATISDPAIVAALGAIDLS
jgi:uncharacterized protein (TIGR03083 family)